MKSKLVHQDKTHEVNEFPMVRCMCCKKEIQAFYGRWGNSGTCSAACERRTVDDINMRYRAQFAQSVTKDEE